MLHTIFHTTLIPAFMKARQEGWLRRSRPSSRSSLASDGQVRSWEGAETRLLIPSPDRRHWLHHCQNNVRRAVREGVLDPRGVDPDRRFSERESAPRRRRHRPTPIDLWVIRGNSLITATKTNRLKPMTTKLSSTASLGILGS